MVSSNQKIIVKSQAFDSSILDSYMLSILNIANENKGYVIGPVPLPIKENQFVIDVSQNINRSKINTHPVRTKHKRIMYIFDESGNDILIQQIAKISLPNGVGVEIKSQD